MLRRFCEKVFNRVFITAILLLLQLVWFVVLYWGALRDLPTLRFTLSIFSAFVGVLVVRHDSNPAYKMGWLFLIGVIPIFGAFMYLFFGNKRPSKRMRARMDAIQKEHVGDLTAQEGILIHPDERMQTTSNYIARYGPFPAWTHTRARYYALGEDIFAQMLADLRAAERFIFVEFFIIADGQMWAQIVDILKEKAQAGVDVRVVYDDVGSLNVLPRHFIVELETSGIHCLPFNPMVPIISLAMNHRDHRKILVVDGIIAYNGGINIADEYINQKTRFGHWKDTGVRLEGAAVWNFTVMFLNLWNAFRKMDEDYEPFRAEATRVAKIETDGIVQPYSDTPLDEESLGENVYLELLAQAKRYVYIFTPYLILDHEMETALCLAAKRGVDVRIVTPGIPDKKLVFRVTRSYYPSLLKSGVRIYEYTAGFLHAKSYLCDDVCAVVGTINMDYRSLYLHFECATLLMQNSILSQIRADYEHVFAQSKRIILEDCARTRAARLFDDFLCLMSPLL